MVVKHQNFYTECVSKFSKKEIQAFYLSTNGNYISLMHTIPNQYIQGMLMERKLIKCYVTQGDYAIVGSCTNVLLRRKTPLNLFVYADTTSKLECYTKRATAEEDLSNTKGMQKEMKNINKDWVAYRTLFTKDRWNSKKKKKNYHLCINNSRMEIKPLISVITAYAKAWFEKKKADE